MNKVRWGLLSTANINYRQIPAIRQSQRGDLVAVASRNAELAAVYARRWQIEHSFGSYDEMLDSDLVDAVYIGLPNHLHAEWTVRALAAGKHVLCEKPFALTLEEVDSMITAARQANRVLAEAFMYRHHSQIKRLRAIIDSGRIGKIASANAVFNFNMRNRENIRLVPEYGGGSLWDVGVYPVSLMQFIFGGPPAQVSAMQWTGRSGVDENFVAIMQWPSGSLARIESAFRTAPTQGAAIIGTEGRIDIRTPFTYLDWRPNNMTVTTLDGDVEAITIDDEYLYSGQIKDMQAAILDGAPPYLTLGESRDHVKTVLALYRAAQEQRVVALSEIERG